MTRPMMTTPFQIKGLPVHKGMPLPFRLAKFMTHLRIRGGHRLLSFAMRDLVLRYDLGEGYAVIVPVYRTDNCWSRQEVAAYEEELVRTIAGAAAGLEDISLIDCGADIGLMSVLLCRSVKGVRKVFAVEPNPAVLTFLEHNLMLLPAEAVALSAAVGKAMGRGRLAQSLSDPSDHARYLEPDPDGPTSVVTVDSLGVTGNVIMKVDVEGGEAAVIEGATQTIARARTCVIAIEAHSGVTRRTGTDPIEFLRLLNASRPFTFTITGPDRAWRLETLDHPLFSPEHLASRTIWNVVARSAS